MAAELIGSIVPGPSPLLLVFDDYHVITNPYVHSLVRFLLLHQPPHLRLIIAGREDPPFPLTRLRARGELVEVRAADLRFSGEEAAAFFRAMGLTLRDGAAAAWAERTEGWAAGLQLAALSLQSRGPLEAEAFLAAFGGSHRYILDYLVAAVPEMFLRGQLITLRDWLAVLPEGIIRRSDDLMAAKAWAFYLTGRIHEAEAYLAGWPANARGDVRV